MAFALRRSAPLGGYVAWPGSPSSYVRNLSDARWFASREEAERNRCPGIETIVTLDLSDVPPAVPGRSRASCASS